MLAQNVSNQLGRLFVAVGETCISAFAVCSLACTPGRKIIPGKEAYKLAHGHGREQIGAVEVNDKVLWKGRSGKQGFVYNLK